METQLEIQTQSETETCTSMTERTTDLPATCTLTALFLPAMLAL